MPRSWRCLVYAPDLEIVGGGRDFAGSPDVGILLSSCVPASVVELELTNCGRPCG